MNKRILLVGKSECIERLRMKAGRLKADLAIFEGDATPERVMQHAQDMHVSGILPLDPQAFAVCAEVGRKLGLAAPGLEWLANGVNKEIWGVLAQRGVSCLPGELISSAESVGEIASTLGVPLWVSPCAVCSGSPRMRVDQEADLVLAMNKARKNSRTGLIHIQRALEGPLFRLYGFQFNGGYFPTEVVEEILPPSPYAVPAGAGVPANLSGAAYQQLVSASQKVVRTLPPGDCMLEMEFAVLDGAPTLAGIQVALPPNEVVIRLLELAYGIDLDADMLRVAMGEAPREVATRGLAAAARWLRSHSGIVEEILGVDAAQALAGVREVHVNVSPGLTLGHVVDEASRDRLGYVVATAGQRAAADALADKACASIEIVTRLLTT